MTAQRKACGVLRALLEGSSGGRMVEHRMAAVLNFAVLRSTMCRCYRNAVKEFSVRRRRAVRRRVSSCSVFHAG